MRGQKDQVFFWLVALLLILQPVTVGLAQEKPSTRSVRERAAPAVELCELLYSSNVRQALGVSEETFDKMHKVLSPIRDAAPTYDDFRRGTFDSRLRATEPMLEKARQIDDMTWAFLSEILPPDRLESLMGSHILFNGVEGLFNERICQALAIQIEQVQKMRFAVDAERSRRRGVLAEVARGQAKDKSRPSLILREESLLAAAIETLEGSQRERLKRMLDSGAEVAPNVQRFTFGW